MSFAFWRAKRSIERRFAHLLFDDRTRARLNPEHFGPDGKPHNTQLVLAAYARSASAEMQAFIDAVDRLPPPRSVKEKEAAVSFYWCVCIHAGLLERQNR